MKKSIDIPGLAKFIAKEISIYHNIDSFNELEELGAFNDCDNTILKKQITIEIRKYKLIRLKELCK
jgi:hypothetical protein